MNVLLRMLVLFSAGCLVGLLLHLFHLEHHVSIYPSHRFVHVRRRCSCCACDYDDWLGRRVDCADCVVEYELSNDGAESCSI